MGVGEGWCSAEWLFMVLRVVREGVGGLFCSGPLFVWCFYSHGSGSVGPQFLLIPTVSSGSRFVL